VSTYLDGMEARAGRAHARLKSIGVPTPWERHDGPYGTHRAPRSDWHHEWPLSAARSSRSWLDGG